MSTLNITIKSYGVLRKFGNTLTVELPHGSSAKDVKAALVNLIGEDQKSLVEECVLANDTEILPDAYIFQNSAPLSILPPVCGG